MVSKYHQLVERDLVEALKISLDSISNTLIDLLSVRKQYEIAYCQASFVIKFCDSKRILVVDSLQIINQIIIVTLNVNILEKEPGLQKKKSFTKTT